MTKLFTVLAFIGFDAARFALAPCARRRRIETAERALAIEVLGLEPEKHGPMHPDSYCACTGELVNRAVRA